MGGRDTETCGRCAMSSVVDTTTSADASNDPYAGDRIEVDDRQLRAVSPAAWLGHIRRRLDEYVTRLTYGR